MTGQSLDQVVTAVRNRVPVDGREARSRHQILVALGRLPEPFDRTADPTHLTASAVVVGPRGVLLHRHKRLGLWLQPGGHIEAGEAPWEAARREGEEETGLALSFAGGDGSEPPLGHVDVHPGPSGHTHLDLRYLLQPGPSDRPDPPAGESAEVQWFSWDQALTVADPGLRGYLDYLLGICR